MTETCTCSAWQSFWVPSCEDTHDGSCILYFNMHLNFFECIVTSAAIRSGRDRKIGRDGLTPDRIVQR